MGKNGQKCPGLSKRMACLCLGGMMLAVPGCGTEQSIVPLAVGLATVLTAGIYAEGQSYSNEVARLDIELKQRELEHRSTSR
jgi:hypothetical protein